MVDLESPFAIIGLTDIGEKVISNKVRKLRHRLLNVSMGISFPEIAFAIL
jgi:hypothetical protein